MAGLEAVFAFLVGALIAAYGNNVRKQSLEWQRDEAHRNVRLLIGYAYFFALGMLVTMVIVVAMGRLSSAALTLGLAIAALALARWLSANRTRLYRAVDPERKRTR
jgi:multisubunit Na+/H+ antiporter MnhE subunit